ncbi:MAG: NAD-dependent deacylase [Pseudomonadota bacterium]
MARPPIVILTGAGISAESGLGTFRDKDGIWTKYPLEDLATPEGFVRNPDFVQGFYNARRAQLKSASPHAGHAALAELEAAWDGAPFLLVTQNVDNLHEQAGSRQVAHMHGELASALCRACGGAFKWEADIEASSACLACGQLGTLRPDVVWFGEIPYHMDQIMVAIEQCELFVSIGTSGAVYPAAGFVQMARETGARTVELNLEPSDNAHAFDEALYGPASEIVPAWAGTIM